MRQDSHVQQMQINVKQHFAGATKHNLEIIRYSGASATLKQEITHAYLGEQRGEEEIVLLIPQDHGGARVFALSLLLVLLRLAPFLLEEPIDGFLQQLHLLPPTLVLTNGATRGHGHVDGREEQTRTDASKRSGRFQYQERKKLHASFQLERNYKFLSLSISWIQRDSFGTRMFNPTNPRDGEVQIVGAEEGTQKWRRCPRRRRQQFACATCGHRGQLVSSPHVSSARARFHPISILVQYVDIMYCTGVILHSKLSADLTELLQWPGPSFR